MRAAKVAGFNKWAGKAKAVSMTTVYILPLRDARDRRHVGGKAAALGDAIRAGFPVPPGFVITADAFPDASCDDGGDDDEFLSQRPFRILLRFLL